MNNALFFIFASGKEKLMDHKDEILKKLVEEAPELQQEAVKEIKENGDLTLVPDLFNLLESGTDHRTTTLLINLLSDIKENAFKELLIGRIRSTSNPSLKSLFVRIAWESALDYSEYADLFARLMIEEEFIVGLEACSVLEGMHKITPSQRQEILQLLKNTRTGEEKQYLIDIVLNALSQSPDPETNEL